MSMSAFPDIFVNIKGRVDSALSGLKQIKMGASDLSKGFGALTDAGSVAAGMLARDLVQGLISATNEAFYLGTQVRTLEKSFLRLVEVSGAGTVSLEELRKATRGTVSDIDLLKAANTAMMLGLPTEELDELMESAMILGHAMGIDTTKAIESLSIGLGRQSRLVLDNLGIVFQAETAYEWYAKQLGVTTNELTELQKREGWQLYAMKEIRDKASELGDVVDETTVKQERWGASWKNLTTRLGEFLAPLAMFQPLLSPIINMIGTMIGILLPRLIAKLMATAAAQWALNTAQAVWNALSGPYGWAVLAGAATALGAWYAYGRIKGFYQKGGFVPETGSYVLHRGEIVLPETVAKSLLHMHAGPTYQISVGRVVTGSPLDFVDKMRRMGRYG